MYTKLLPLHLISLDHRLSGISFLLGIILMAVNMQLFLKNLNGGFSVGINTV